ncbi:hypothetical protein [Marinomonas sp. TI.3.20]|uniref:hypothetical protein n=1 Tax=Marinomonas sp. TI.3.20 TaxID=3121296 RepID=UPI004053594F
MPRIPKDIVLCSDSHLTFEKLAAKHKLEHKVQNASDNEHVKKQHLPHLQRQQLPSTAKKLAFPISECHHQILTSLPWLVSVV